jgi:NADH-quinone oxidoreductase subunit J
MTFYSVIFYILAFVLIASTAMAISCTRLVHVVVYLIISFFATALLFYLLGAPFLAVLEVIIYAGAIMVMFLFIILTLRMEEGERKKTGASFFRQWIPAMVLSTISLVLMVVVMWEGSGHAFSLKPAMVPPLEFGAYIFSEFWFPVEVASFLLFVALVGALYLGRKKVEVKKVNESTGEAS